MPSPRKPDGPREVLAAFLWAFREVIGGGHPAGLGWPALWLAYLRRNK